MPRLLRMVGTLGFALCAGCYHATVETGATPSSVVVHKTFASSWIYGLVPPSTVETASRCPYGSAKVETQLSFVNQVVSLLTLGIYTPMEIKVTCAAVSQAQSTRTQEGGQPPTKGLGEQGLPTSPSRPATGLPPSAAQGAPQGAIRTNNELMENATFRQAMMDVQRMKIVAGFREVRPDTLTVELDHGAFTSASTEYNLSRVYGAYGATTEYNRESALELLQDDMLVGWFSSGGLTWQGDRAQSRAAPGANPQPNVSGDPIENAYMPAPEVSDDESASRDGFYFNAGFGGGSLGLLCDGCDGAREWGYSGFLSLGGHVGQTTALGIESTGWIKEESDFRSQVYTLMGNVTQFASASSGLFLRGGIGLLGFRNDDDITASALGFSVRLGYEIGGASARAVPYVAYVRTFDGADLKFDGESVGFNVAFSNIQIGLGIAVH